LTEGGIFFFLLALGIGPWLLFLDGVGVPYIFLLYVMLTWLGLSKTLKDYFRALRILTHSQTEINPSQLPTNTSST
jgi:hypothetical protein